MTVDPVIVIPVYNHGDAVSEVVDSVSEYNMPGVLVNDGSNARTRDVLNRIDDRHELFEVIHREENGGKGRAVTRGLEYAKDNGYTHAIQIDADRQHDSSDIPEFLQVAENHPEALVLGAPEFDEDVPLKRLYGRQISRFWVWLLTLSFDIEDPLCGYRCYPVEKSLDVIQSVGPGVRMEFDPEIAVRMHWQGTPVKSVRTSVRYFEDGLSNFRLFQDNVMISWMFCRLFFRMLVRVPWIISNRFRV